MRTFCCFCDACGHASRAPRRSFSVIEQAPAKVMFFRVFCPDLRAFDQSRPPLDSEILWAVYVASRHGLFALLRLRPPLYERLNSADDRDANESDRYCWVRADHERVDACPKRSGQQRLGAKFHQAVIALALPVDFPGFLFPNRRLPPSIVPNAVNISFSKAAASCDAPR